MADIFATHTVSCYIPSYFSSYLIFFPQKYLKNTGVSKKRVKNSEFCLLYILNYFNIQNRFFKI